MIVMAAPLTLTLISIRWDTFTAPLAMTINAPMVAGMDSFIPLGRQ